MMHHHRRGFTLIQIVTMLPIIAAIGTLGTQIVTRAMRVQEMELTLRRDDAIMHDLVRRIQRDARQADHANVRKIDADVLLQLMHADRIVSYQVSGYRVTRTEQTGDETVFSSKWQLEQTQMDLELETIGASPRIVWIKFAIRSPVERGFTMNRHLSAAATIGRGGPL